MSEEKRSPSEELRAMLDERGIEHEDPTDTCTNVYVGGVGYRFHEYDDQSYEMLRGKVSISTGWITPEQAIAATVNVGETYTREECEAQFVRGFSLGCLPSGSDPCWDENRQTLDEHMAELGWVRKDAEKVERSCASCPEVDNPDSYIVHLQSALKWHDQHVPRPTNPNATCVVLQGERPPEEVMFVREDGEVMHYLPEGTCHMRLAYEEEDADGFIWPDHYECDACGAKVNGIMPFYDTEIPPKYCPNCRARVKEEAE